MTAILERAYKPPDTAAVTPQDVREWEMGLRNNLSPEELRDIMNKQRELIDTRVVVAGVVLASTVEVMV